MKTINFLRLSFILLSFFSLHMSFAQNTFPASGNVGIGTSNPKAQLDVVSSTNAIDITDSTASFFTIRNTNTSIANNKFGLVFGVDNRFPRTAGIFADGNYRTNANTSLVFATRGTVSDITERMRISHNGSVGIGTEAPTGKLTVHSKLTTDVNNNTSFLSPNIGINISHIHWGKKGDWFIRSANSGGKVVIQDTGGKVGIGTATPETRLHLAHTSSASLTGKSAFGGIHLEQTGGRDRFVGITTDATSHSNTTQGGILLQGSGGYGTKIHFLTTDNYLHGMKQRMIIDHKGNVGIGITNIPEAYKFAVDGKVICEELKVQLSSNWPDYVFQKDYQLPTLDEVAASIETNGHLPGIPSAASIEAEGGIELGEMQRKMMEKMEEMMLYILQQQQEIEALKAQLYK